MTHLSFLAQTQSFFFLSRGASLHPRPDAPSLSTVAHLLYPRPYDPPSFKAAAQVSILVQMPLHSRPWHILSIPVRRPPLHSKLRRRSRSPLAQVFPSTGAGLPSHWRKSLPPVEQVQKKTEDLHRESAFYAIYWRRLTVPDFG